MKLRVLLPAVFFLIFTGLISYSFAETQAISKQTPAPEKQQAVIPEKKQTVLGLYVTAKEAYAMWHINKDTVKILDVRTPEEYIFVGHAPMAYNIPIKFLKRVDNKPVLDAEKKKPAMELNPHFVEEVKKNFKESDTILVHCRSGARSASATNLLADAGFKKVYNIIDGFEGDKIHDENSYFNGKRMKNGWKNAGAPWTYKLNPDLMYIP